MQRDALKSSMRTRESLKNFRPLVEIPEIPVLDRFCEFSCIDEPRAALPPPQPSGTAHTSKPGLTPAGL